MNAATPIQSATLQEITDWTWREKYRYIKPDGSTEEHSIEDTHKRVVEGVYELDSNATERDRAFALMTDLVWCPAGRIHAGAGTGSRVTLINCFVSPTIEDSMHTEVAKNSLGIADALNVAMFTQQMGGGIGMDFSTLRPDGARVKRTNSVSTGPLPFMGMWDAMCQTIKSSGSRRGAMMAVMRCDHPDIRKFIHAKRKAGVLTNFNISVLVTDRFMKAVERNEDWSLGFTEPRADGQHVAIIDPQDGSKPFYVYEVIKARQLWDEITRNTYDYAEPGVIFINWVNALNNLWYCERIAATNPCGEQPLPPNGACNLGAQNLAQLVRDPFLNPRFDFQVFKQSVHTGMRFLDNVLDISLYATEAQQFEAVNKRRTGMGITGLGNCLQMMRLRYGSHEAVEFTRKIMVSLRDEAYRASIDLAKERGPFPAFERDNYMKGKFIKTLPEDIREGIFEHGIRNGVLLTIAPTGTTSMYYGNVSSGLEPTFSWKYKRKALEQDGSFREFKEVFDYGYLRYKEVVGHEWGEPLPDYMVTAQDLTVDEHLHMQAVCQQYVDASISKTINTPRDISFEDFQGVYTKAYKMGLKGCTTYRPNDVRGSILSVDEEVKKASETVMALTSQIVIEPRPEELEGTTYKIKYPGVDQAFYITINDYIDFNGKHRPFEIFINSKSVKHQEWIVALTRMISSIFRRGGDVTFICEELKQVFSSNGGAWVNKKFVPSLAALIGHVIEKHFIKIGLLAGDESAFTANLTAIPLEEGSVEAQQLGETCPSCQAPTLLRQEGCKKCGSCGYSDCG